MLALALRPVISRARMGSTQPPDPSDMFGYSIEHEYDNGFSNVNPPPQPPPGPPPGPPLGQPLLSEGDHKIIETFFNSFQSDEFVAPPLFGEMGFADLGDDWSFSLNNLPPSYVAHTTDFGQQPPAAVDSSANAFQTGLFNAQHPLQMTYPLLGRSPVHDLQHAAAVLNTPNPLPSAQMPPGDFNPDDLLFGVLGPATALQLGHPPFSAPMQNPMQNNSSQYLADFSQDRRLTHPIAGSSSEHAAAMALTTAAPPPARPAAALRTQSVDFQYGSDASFGRSAFVPPSENETSQALEGNRMEYLKCLRTEPSAAASPGPSSATLKAPPVISPTSRDRRKKSALDKDEDEAKDAPPNKRRKSTVRAAPIVKKEPNSGDEKAGPSSVVRAPPTKPSARKQKGKAKQKDPEETESEADHETTAETSKAGATAAAAAAAGAGAKRKKSGTHYVTIKPPRENLTEEQRRENHIKSEQKRRHLIKDGFDDICSLVPGLRGGGNSKSLMLNTTGDWLEDIVRGNRALQALLEDASGKSSA